MRSRVLMAAAVLALAANAWAGSEFDDFARRVGKLAPLASTRVTKTLCACLAPRGIAGRVVQTRTPHGIPTTIQLACELPSFGPDGSVGAYTYCYEFVTLAK
ncbi:MAG: hypothetical protein AB1689_13505 [Thermodesulfobacteriota bacterium]